MSNHVIVPRILCLAMLRSPGGNLNAMELFSIKLQMSGSVSWLLPIHDYGAQKHIVDKDQATGAERGTEERYRVADIRTHGTGLDAKRQSHHP